MKTIKIILIQIIFLCTSFYSQAQNYLTWNEIENIKFGQENIFRTNRDKKNLEGDYKISETSGAYSEIRFKNGKIDGKYIVYDFEGRIASSSTYSNGKIQGKSTTYFQNGNIASEYYYKDHQPIGKWLDYNKKGEITSTQNYKNGKKDGKWTRIIRNPAENTKSTLTEYYKDDQPTGHWEERLIDGPLKWEKDYSSPVDYMRKSYYPNGTLAEERQIKDRRKNGITKQYTQEGILLNKINYDNDHIVDQEVYYKNGILRTKTHYKYGRINGPYVAHTEEGIKIIEGNHKDTYKDGIWRKFDEKKGRLIRETTYKNDVKNGLCKHYNKAKNVALEGNYLNGKKNGIWKYYDLAGELEKEIEYDKGKQLSEKNYN
ncbi:toxin-antitoxin system YwqK family antitoxin [Aquimarina algiphila]|uniref:toxin-antitoxin system YwqK family antitoxin n=1 Tax=Aquimarina algiphila TaxID=2047982 RepID=UPI00232B6451|nr:hypothetical protein [Aquimarina algiphila]